MLYTVLALARLHPAALGHDLFVRYGTQDHYTIFSPLYAAAIRAGGLEPGAAVLAFATHVAFFGAAWLVARRLLSASEALLAVGLLAVLPSWYGSNSVFAYIEGFLTPRQSAEHLRLQVSQRLCIPPCAGRRVHDRCAAAASDHRGRGRDALDHFVRGFVRPPVTAIVIGILSAALVGVSAAGIGPFAHFDANWLHMLQSRLTYLFPTRWTFSEWLAMGIRAAVLIVGIGFSRTDGPQVMHRDTGNGWIGDAVCHCRERLDACHPRGSDTVLALALAARRGICTPGAVDCD